MKTVIAALATSALVLMASGATADTDLRGLWSGDYTAVSPTNSGGTGPRFNQAQWELEITDQQGNVFYGESRWRRESSGTWRSYQATGNIRADGSGNIGIIEIAPEEPYAVNSVINGQLEDGKLYVDFRSLRNGTTYSAVLERQPE